MALEPQSPDPQRAWAGALFASKAPRPSVEEALRRHVSLLPPDARKGAETREWLALAVSDGRLDDALTLAEGLEATLPADADRTEHAEAVRAKVDLALELGDTKRAAAWAKDFIDRMPAYPPYPFAPDPSIGFVEPLFRAGILTASEVELRRAAWLASEIARTRAADPGMLSEPRGRMSLLRWSLAYGTFAETKEQAAEVGALPPRLPNTLVAGAIIALPTGLILLQPDFGTAMLVASGGAFALYLAGLSWWWFVGVAVAAVISAPLGWFFYLQQYQKDRVLTFLDPERDPLGTGWNIIQSKIAIGSGGFMGQGWGKGTQSHLNYVPEHTTDFIFAVLSEEFGWIGVAVVLLLSLFIIGRCLWIASEARDGFSRLLAGSLGLALFVYVIVNGGMVSGMLPVVGVPMPLLSFGGTAAVSLLAGMGVVMAVQAGNETRRR